MNLALQNLVARINVEKARVREAEVHLNEAVDKLTEALKSSTASLEEKWSFWLTIPDHCKRHSEWVIPCLGYICPMDSPLYVEKYCTVEIPYMIESLQEALDDGEDLEYSQEDIDRVKQYVIDNNVGSFVYDW